MNTKQYFFLLHKSMQRSLSLCLLVSHTVAGCSYGPAKLTIGEGRHVNHRAARSRQHHRYNFSILEPRQTASIAWSRFVSCYHAPWSKKGPKVKRCLCIGLPFVGITTTALSGIVWWLSSNNGVTPTTGTTANDTLTEMEATNDALRNETFMPTIGLDSMTTAFILNAIENNALADIQTERTTATWSYDPNNSSVSNLPLTSTLGSTTTVATTEGFDQSNSSVPNLPLTSALSSTLLTSTATTQRPSSATTVGLSKEKKKALNNELIKAVKEKDWDC